MFTPGPWINEKNGTITTVCSRTDGKKVVCCHASADDARLIAAAPDMYRLLRERANSDDGATSFQNEVLRVVGQVEGNRT